MAQHQYIDVQLKDVGFKTGNTFYTSTITMPVFEQPEEVNVSALGISEAFKNKIIEVAQKLGTNPDWILVAMSIETGGTFNPAIQNTKNPGKYGPATGLIQFYPLNRNGMTSVGKTIYELKQMGQIEQMDYVYLYLSQYGRYLNSLTNVYLSIFYPKAISKPDNYVFPASVQRANGWKTKADVQYTIFSRYNQYRNKIR